MSTPARSVAARSSASRCSPASRSRRRNSASLESTDELLAGLRVLDDDHAGVGKLVLARVEQADRDDLVTLGELEQRHAPSPGAVMKSEMSTTSERRRIAPRA